ncbi:MAG TPA: ATP-binding protein [Polyangia bacterium]|nr:ATP-binding protein [Polyangia bacterium]
MTEPLRILLIDDDEVDRMSVRRLLGGAAPPPAIVECDSGEAALERVGEETYDCVLLDVRLPGQSGLDVLRAIRAADVRTPIIMLTGFGDEETAVECMKAGASDYIGKANLNGQRLLNSVRQSVRVHDAEGRAQAASVELRRHADQLHALARAAADLSVATAPDDLRVRLATAARDIIGAEVAVAGTFEERGRAGCDISVADAGGSRSARLHQPPPGLGPTRLGAAALARDPEAQQRAARLGLPMPARGWLMAPLWDPARQVVGFVHLTAKREGDFDGRDESLLAQLAQLAGTALNNGRLLRQAQAETRLREDMIAVVSHDLRNPLNVMALAAKAMLGGPQPVEGALRQKVERIDRAAEHMRALIEDLLDLSRIKSGQLELDLQPFPTGAIVDDSLEAVRPLAQEKKIDLRADVSCPGQRVLCDPRRLRQVFSNLLGNALKFTPAGGRIRVGAREEQSCVCFSVSDTGPGVPREHQAHIFDRYWQAPETARQGAGLGLFIAKGIVDAHRGSISLESEPGDGATFHFRIPTEGAAG